MKRCWKDWKAKSCLNYAGEHINKQELIIFNINHTKHQENQKQTQLKD